MSALVEELVSKIKEAATAYYNSDAPIMSDDQFDLLVEQLKSIDPDNEILTSPGWGVEITNDVSHLVKYPHSFTVGSLNKVQSVSFDRQKIHHSSNENIYVEAAKLDGISGVAYYTNGKLDRVLSRNDGLQGLDITANLIYCNIPKEVHPDIKWVRGEVVTTWDAARKYDYSHPRNMASGLANSKELVEAHKELHFVVYRTNLSDDGILRYDESITHLAASGFETVRASLITNLSDYEVSITRFDYTRDNYIPYDYPVDGSVLTNVEDGTSFAVKYPTQYFDVEVVDILNNVSDHGRIIPVLKLVPTVIAGAEITYTNGFNYNKLVKFGVAPGSIIKLTRANEVIPHWNYDMGVRNPQHAIIPEEVDGQPTFWDGVHLRINVDKTASSVYTLIAWKSPDGIGYSYRKKLIEAFDIKTHRDLAVLASNAVSGNEVRAQIKEIFTEAYADRMYQLLVNIDEGFTLSKLLESTYTGNMGTEACERLAKYYENCDNLLIMDLVTYGTTVGLNPKVSKLMPTCVVTEGVKSNYDLIIKVLTAGFMIKEPIVIDNSKLIKIALTGKLSKPRGKLLEEWLGKVVEASVKDADYLVTDNPGSGSAKNQEATKHNTIIINEAEFRNIIGA